MRSFFVWLFLLLLASLPTVCWSNDDALTALSTLYSSAGGSSWTRKENWLSGDDPCAAVWYGVSCSSDGVVTSLRLNENNLGPGTIPTELGLLTGVQSYFRLDGNRLSGTVPTELGRLSLITRVFYLWQNDLVGALPSQLGELTGISSSFAVSSNELSRRLPTELGRLSVLSSEFRLHVNQVGDLSARWEGWGGFVVIRPKEGLIIAMSSLFFDNTKNHAAQFSGPLPSQLGHLSKLDSYFDVSSNLFCGDIPGEVLELRVSSEGFGLEEGNGFGTPCFQPTSDSSPYAVEETVATTVAPVMSPATVQQTLAPAIPTTTTGTPSSSTLWENAHPASLPSPSPSPSPSHFPPPRPNLSIGSTDQGHSGVLENHRSASLQGITIALAIASTAALVASRLTYLLCIDRPWERIKTRTQSEVMRKDITVACFWKQNEASMPLLSDAGADSSCTHGLRRLRYPFRAHPFILFGRRKSGTTIVQPCASWVRKKLQLCVASGLFKPIAMFVTGACVLLIYALKTLDRCLGVCVLSLIRCLIYLNIWRPQGASSDDEIKSSLDPSSSESDDEQDSGTSKGTDNSELSDDVDYMPDPEGLGIVTIPIQRKETRGSTRWLTLQQKRKAGQLGNGPLSSINESPDEGAEMWTSGAQSDGGPGHELCAFQTTPQVHKKNTERPHMDSATVGPRANGNFGLGTTKATKPRDSRGKPKYSWR